MYRESRRLDDVLSIVASLEHWHEACLGSFEAVARLLVHPVTRMACSSVPVTHGCSPSAALWVSDYFGICPSKEVLQSNYVIWEIAPHRADLYHDLPDG